MPGLEWVIYALALVALWLGAMAAHGRFGGMPPAVVDVPHWAAEWTWLPVAAREVAAAYTTALGKSAESETGWCRFRDRVFLPCAVDGFLWLCGKSLECMAEKQGDGHGNDA